MATQQQQGTSDFKANRQSGWRAVTSKPAVSKIIDALLGLPREREFNKSELAELANVSRNTVGNHADLLLDLGVIEEVEHAQRFRVNPDSEVFRLATKLDAAARDQLREPASDDTEDTADCQ